MAKITFKIGKDTYTGDTVEKIVSNVHHRYKGTKHPFANYNVLYNAVLKDNIEVELTKSQTKPTTVGETVTLKPESVFNRRLTAKEAVVAGKALINMNIFQKVISQSEATRRANICRKCPMLVDVSDCGSCTGARRRLARLAASLTGFFQKKLKLGTFKGKDAIKAYCGVCGCSMQMLLPVRTSDYKPAAFLKPDSRPIECWLRKDSDNYVES